MHSLECWGSAIQECSNPGRDASHGRTRLFILGCFAQDPQRVLTTAQRLALVLVELNLHIYFRVVLDWLFGMELGIATFAYAKGNGSPFHDPQLALLHGPQCIASGRQDVTPVEIKRRLYPSSLDFLPASRYMKH